MRRFLVSLTAVGLLASPATLAGAQESANETALARQLFQEGIDAVRGNDFETARLRFARSYNLSQRPVTLLNLAGAQSQTNHLVEAAESYKRYLHMTQDGGDERRRRAAREALQRLEPRIPHVVITIHGLHPHDRVTFDDDRLSHAAIGQRFPVDPGDHTLELWRRGAEPVVEAFEISEGDDRRVNLQAPSAPPTPPTPDEVAENGGEGGGNGGGGEVWSGGGGGGIGGNGEENTGGGGGLFASPLFWVVVGAVVLGGAGFAGWYLFLREDEVQSGFEGNLGPGHLILN